MEPLLDRLKDNLWLLGKRLERDRQRLFSHADEAGQRRSLAVLLLLLARRQKYVAADLDFIEALKLACRSWVQAQRPEAPSCPTEETARRAKPARKRVEPITAAGSHAPSRARK